MSLHNNHWIYTVDDIRQLEKKAMESISALELMQGAGRAAFQWILGHYPLANHIVIYCGPGNNGGDGYALALELFSFGKNVLLVQVDHERPRRETAEIVYLECVAKKIPCLPFSALFQLSDFHFDLQVDAILGIGATVSFSENINVALKWLRAQNIPIFSLDVPSGIDAQTGLALTEDCIQADSTLSFIALKRGLLQGHAINACGELACDDLQMTESMGAQHQDASILAMAEIIQKKKLPKRCRDMHKGQAGHVLIVGSDRGYLGASRLAGMAALRAGAGKVSIATHPDHVMVLQGNHAELMVHGVHEGEDLHRHLQGVDVMILGVGLGRSAWSKSLFDFVMSCSLPILIDADGLYFLALEGKASRPNLILTPHPLEAARLLSSTTAQVQADRFAALNKLVEQYQATVILKGARTQVGSPHQVPAICMQGNPGMASAGMGDVLSGIIAGFWAQGLTAFDAAKQGVFYHAAAGDRLAAMQGEVGMLASEIADSLPKVIHDKF